MATHDERERILADSQFGSGATSYSPATWYLALSLTVPNEDGTNFTEPVGNNYSRAAITNNVTNFPNATTVGGITIKVNGTKFTFPNPSGLWGALIYYGWFTASSGGFPQYSNPLDTPITARNGNTPVEFDINQLVMPFN